MKRIFLFIFCIVFILASQQQIWAAQWSRNLNVVLGLRVMDEDDWEPVQNQFTGGLQFDVKQAAWPVSVAADFIHAFKVRQTADRTGCFGEISGYYDAASSVSELDFGVRKIWEISPSVGATVRPFVGGGISLIDAKLKVSVSGSCVSDSDTGMGLWIGGGVYWSHALSPGSLNIGFDIRASWANVEIFGEEVNAGAIQAGPLVGFHW